LLSPRAWNHGAFRSMGRTVAGGATRTSVGRSYTSTGRTISVLSGSAAAGDRQSMRISMPSQMA
jgi:hypothetical protein